MTTWLQLNERDREGRWLDSHKLTTGSATPAAIQGPQRDDWALTVLGWGTRPPLCGVNREVNSIEFTGVVQGHPFIAPPRSSGTSESFPVKPGAFFGIGADRGRIALTPSIILGSHVNRHGNELRGRREPYKRSAFSCRRGTSCQASRTPEPDARLPQHQFSRRPSLSAATALMATAW